MRAFTVFLFCLSIAFQGISSTHVFDKPCPMEQDMEQGMYPGMMGNSGGASDCCNDAETAAKTGKLCKTGQECSLSQVFIVVPSQSPDQKPLATTPIVASNLFHPLFNPSDIWRPPTFS